MKALVLAALMVSPALAGEPCKPSVAQKALSNMSVVMGAGYGEGGTMPFTFGLEKYLEAGWSIGLMGFHIPDIDGSTYDVPVDYSSRLKTWPPVPTSVPFTTPDRDYTGVIVTVRIPL